MWVYLDSWNTRVLTKRAPRAIIGSVDEMAQTWRPRREATATARKLWQPLQGKRMANLKFHRQHRRGSYLAAFWVPNQG